MTIGINRVFLGWNDHALDMVAVHLYKKYKKENLDMTGKLVVVPTSQAITKLKEALAVLAAADKQAVIGACIVTPAFLFTPRNPEKSVATGTVIFATWMNVLKKCKADVLSPIFPYGLKSDKTESLLKFAEIVSKVRTDLSDNLMSVSAVLANHSHCLAEIDRWQAMSELEKQYLEALDAQGFCDPTQAKMREARSPSIEDDYDEIILCGAPEISGLAANAVKVMAQKLSVTVLVHAPESLAGSFDEFGRPVSGKWQEADIDIPEWRDRLYMETTPSSQALRVAGILNQNARKHGPDDIAIGVPDRDIIPYLQDELEAKGISAYDPQDISCAEQPVFRLISNIAEVLDVGAYQNFARLLRTPDFLRHLQHAKKVEIAEVLEELDDFRNEHLSEFLGSIEQMNGKVPAGLTKVLQAVEAIKKDYSSENPADFWRKTLAGIYTSRELSTKDAADNLFKSAAEQINDVLTELESCPVKLNRAEFNRLFLYMVSNLQITRNRDGERVDLNGWLELHWNNAPLMVITGMNEDFVPGVRLSDMFLPNTLRRKLGLKDDSLIFARDVYLLTAMAESRRKSGLLYLTAGKFSADGSPLKPSRLMFKCSLAELADRAKRMFERPRELISKPPAMASFKHDPVNLQAVKDMRVSKRISVTSLKDYLECPFRFFLKHVVGMEEATDDITAINPALFGTLLHNTLSKTGAEGELGRHKDPGKLALILCEQVAVEFKDQFGQHLPAAVLLALNSAKERLKAAARIQAGLNSQNWTVLARQIEQKFKLEAGGYVISGKIDRIDYNPDTRTLRIIDYKTGTFDGGKSLFSICAKATRDDVSGDYRSFRRGDKNYIWKDLQLPIYYHMIKECGIMQEYRIDNIELAYFTLPKAVSETDIMLWEQKRESDSEQILDNALECCRRVIERIDQGVFWPPAEKVQYDDFENLFLYDIKDSWAVEKI